MKLPRYIQKELRQFVVVLLGLFTFADAALAFSAEPKRPNIVLIMVDDMGISDIGCYGAEILTPNLDRLADEGVRFRQFYNTSKCFTSRACLLTGAYAQQVNMGESHLSLQNAITLAEVLKQAGYSTYASGKHHGDDNLYNRGFDHYYGLRDGAANHFNPGLQRVGEPAPAQKTPNRIWADDALEFTASDPAYQSYFPEDFYSTDVFTDKALDYLSEWEIEDSGHPFFLYLAYTAPHDPLMAHPEDIAKYEGVYDVGYDAIRNARYQKQLEQGLFNASQYALSPAIYQDWDSLSQLEKDDEARRMQVYAAMVDRVDQRIGDLMQKLQDIGAYEDTLILFCSDNGSSSANVNLGDVSAEIGGLERYASLKLHWANVGNTPFQFFKDNSDEGGIRTPLICHWPKGITNPGRFADKAGHFVDFMATFVDLTGAEYPNTRNGAPVVPMQGESFTDVLFDQAQARLTPIFFQWQVGEAMIDGDYKLLKHSTASPWKLFDLSVDATELNDLSNAEPVKYTELLAAYNAWYQAVKGNEIPVVTDDELFIAASGDSDLDVLHNDYDTDGSIDSTSLVITSEPLYGSAFVADGIVRYTPSSVVTRFDRFAYQCQDDDGEFSSIAYVTIRFVGDVNSSETIAKIEAEEATTVTGIVQDNRSTASAGEFVNFNPASPAQFIEWEVSLPTASTYKLSFRYANADRSGRMLKVSVNGQLVNDSLSFPFTGSWDVWSLLEVSDLHLNAGINAIRIETLDSKDGSNVDYLSIAAGIFDDSDLDQMPDWYEDLIPELDKNSAADARTDLDEDGASNLEEYFFYTDPLDPASRVNLTIQMSSATEAILSGLQFAEKPMSYSKLQAC
ncbi:sulfatase-like hydrolase/transferase [Coraliomargarita sp. W4R72]